MNVPAPWSGRLPWDDPPFAERMLAEHLDQGHDLASRRLATVDAQVAWIHEEVLGGTRSDVLDLCCGPGLYTARLALRGHTCTGIDFSPAAIAYARVTAERTGAAGTYRCEDVHAADLGKGRDLVMLLFGDLDTFPPDAAARLIGRASGALAPGGRLLLEVHRREAVERVGTAPPSRSSHAAGLFGPDPYDLEQASTWDPAAGLAVWAATVTHSDGRVAEISITTADRAEHIYPEMLAAAGLESLHRYAGLGSTDPDFTVLVAERR